MKILIKKKTNSRKKEQWLVQPLSEHVLALVAAGFSKELQEGNGGVQKEAGSWSHFPQLLE